MVRTWLNRNAPPVWVTVLWCAALVSMAGMFAFLPENSWDLRVVTGAMQFLQRGEDPYAASLAQQKAEAALGHRKDESALGHHFFVYIYPPVSIEFLKVLNKVPLWLCATLFWVAYAAGFVLQLWAGSRFALASEWRVLRFVLPLVMFFPAFVPSDTLVSGNIVIPMYGALLAAAVRGWRKERWGMFYAVVVAASLFKPPLLLWLLIPFLLGRAQRVWAVVAGLCGVGLFVVQKALWPQRFADFLSSVRYTLPLEINYSVVGVLDKFLLAVGHPSERAAMAVYMAACLLILTGLTYFAGEFRRRNITGVSFAVVLLVSTALLAPRLKEYDLLPITIPMVLIVLRGVRNRVALIVLVVGALAAGLELLLGQVTAVDITSVATVFLVGMYGLRREAKAARTLRQPEGLATSGSPVIA